MAAIAEDLTRRMHHSHGGSIRTAVSLGLELRRLSDLSRFLGTLIKSVAVESCIADEGHFGVTRASYQSGITFEQNLPLQWSAP